MAIPPGERRDKELALATAFSPSAPIDEADLFSGRLKQIRQLLDVLFQKGQHAAIYGERGVGKTSLANVLGDLTRDRASFVTVKINCSADEDFHSLWSRVLGEIRLIYQQRQIGFLERETATTLSLAEGLPERITPDDVRLRLSLLSSQVIIIFDEFDRVSDPATSRLMADTIKALSDHSVNVTVIVVGVADNIDQLIHEHASIDRALEQVQMPRMSKEELEEILNKGMNRVGMSIDTDARDYITSLCLGLPHYAHLLGQISARHAIDQERVNISSQDVAAAIRFALDEKIQQSTRSLYHKATTSPRRESLYAQVLLACALARVDDLGFFAASDVREPMSRIMGKRYEIPAFSSHLHGLSEGERGPVLQKVGSQRRFRFRFRNPLMEPYIIMRGLADGMITDDLLREVGKLR